MLGTGNHSYQPIRGDEGDVELQPLVRDASTSSFSSQKQGKYATFASFIVFIAIVGLISVNIGPLLSSDFESGSSDDNFDSRNRYVLKNFDKTNPMSNFLNGIGGIWGVPLWAFYVNRGQAITSFGKQNKDSAIAKFVTAEKAYFQTPYTGFRTFLKGKRNSKTWNHMPFFPDQSEISQQAKRNMMIGLNEMEIEEISDSLNLATNILYYVAPEQDSPALIRQVTFTNLDSSSSLQLDVLDGLAQLIPNGLGNNAIDAMGRTMEAWMNVYNIGQTGTGADTKITVPFYHISQGTADTAQVQLVKDGFYSFSYLGKECKDSCELLSYVVDPSIVFGTDTTLSNPSGFFDCKVSAEEFTKSPQGTTSRTPSAFAGTHFTLGPLENITLVSVYGYAESLDTLTNKYLPPMMASSYANTKRKRANEILSEIAEKVETKSGNKLFDSYVKQDFLDNFLRGGLPLLLGNTGDGSAKVFHVFSRIHGDIERDYNYFQIDTTYFSQGPGNFRDVCQNRRGDVSHSPFVGDFNIRLFLSFIQADGFNPLTIASPLFRIPGEKLDAVIDSLHVKDPAIFFPLVRAILVKPFRPGQFFKDCLSQGIDFTISKADVVAILISAANQQFAGQFSQNGFWSDHWTYILDLVDNYLTVFPDKEESLLWESTPIPFYMSPAIVKPRSSRYVAVDNPAQPGTRILRVYNAIASWGDPLFSQDKINAMNTIFQDPVNYWLDSNGAANVWQRQGNNAVFTVSIISKLIMLGTLKYSMFDPFGMGIEMEGGKPGWNDAMNGLPGLLGSGMPETYEMLRIIMYCKDALTRHAQRAVEFPIEFTTMIAALDTALDVYEKSGKQQMDDFTYWDSTNTARESYRASTIATFTGERKSLSSDYLIGLFTRMITKSFLGINKSLLTTSNGMSPTYFYYDCTEFTTDSSGGIHATNFHLRTLPLFLEGPTRYLKILTTVEERRDVYQKVKASSLYDVALKMYTLCESLASMGQDVGRMKAFSPGWLENQSVWLHMSYKFYLELLRGQLYEEFFEEIATGLVPFMDNEIYGRSPLEAASFIVSSAFPDKKFHGRSFLARLSGSTAELLSMWIIMVSGHSPFSMNSSQGGSLQLKFEPILPGTWFDDNNEVTFKFLGQIDVTYRNPHRVNTWTTQAKHAQIIKNDGSIVNDDDGIIDNEMALLVRALQVKQIIVEF